MATWELHVDRQVVHKSGSRKRTYGRYEVVVKGVAMNGLAGFMCESIGPGDNKKAENGKRVEAGTYPLWTQFGKYRSIGYSTDQTTAGAAAMPALLLSRTYKRSGILIHPAHPPNLFLSSVGCLNPTGSLTETQNIDFWDSRARVIALIESLRQFAPTAFAHEVMAPIEGASCVITGEPLVALTSTSDPAFAKGFATTLATAEPASLPISHNAARLCAKWLMDNFGPQIRAAVVGKAYRARHLCAIVCQETAFKWVPWISSQSAQTIVKRAVFDASGDYPGTSRSAFPKDTPTFRTRYGNTFTDMLIEEANITRRMQGWSDQDWVYKGYGLFQYDLQHVSVNRDFFENKRWYNFDNCLAACCSELDTKLADAGGNLWDAIRRYNGSGAKADRYRDNVKVFAEYCGEITGD
jgi:hypothetical protein